MLSALLSFLSGFLVKFLTGALADWRRDRALVALGAAEAAARTNKETADAEERMRRANAVRDTDADLLDRMRRGQF